MSFLGAWCANIIDQSDYDSFGVEPIGHMVVKSGRTKSRRRNVLQSGSRACTKIHLHSEHYVLFVLIQKEPKKSRAKYAARPQAGPPPHLARANAPAQN